jgi:hypothetical protein
MAATDVMLRWLHPGGDNIPICGAKKEGATFAGCALQSVPSL